MKNPFRSLLRSLFKLAIRLRYGRSFGHASMWLPYLSLTRARPDRSGEIFYKRLKVGTLASTQALVDIAPDKLFIIGSGPSVRNNDLSLIPEGSAILLNGALALVGHGLARPLAVAIEDERFVYRHFAMLKEKVDGDIVCLLSVPVLRAICEKDREWPAHHKIILIDNVRKPYRLARRDAAALGRHPAAVLEADGSVGFSRDPDWGVFQGGSVVVSALQFAVRCKPATIGLLGIDISNANEPRFYEAKGAMAKSGVARATERIVSHLQLARRVAEAEAIAILNHSPVSVLRSAGFGYDNHLERDDGRRSLSN